MQLRWRINLLEDGSVVTADGEYLGTWDTDESDAFYEFTPDGADRPLLIDPFLGQLCKRVACWHLKVPYDPDISLRADHD